MFKAGVVQLLKVARNFNKSLGKSKAMLEKRKNVAQGSTQAHDNSKNRETTKKTKHNKKTNLVSSLK